MSLDTRFNIPGSACRYNSEVEQDKKIEKNVPHRLIIFLFLALTLGIITSINSTYWHRRVNEVISVIIHLLKVKISRKPLELSELTGASIKSS